MKYYIALDSSGSKTDSILFDQKGKVLARDYCKGANAFDIGPDEAVKRICATIDRLKESLPANGKVAGIFGSVSVISFYPEIQDKVSKYVGIPCKLDSIVGSVMAAVLGQEDGVCIVSGTGAYCCIREKDHHRRYLGGTGYLLDTGGSGFELGRQAMIAAQRDMDGRGVKTMLTQMIWEDVGETVIEHLPVIYAGGRPYIAAFSSLVFKAYEQRDAAATEIFNRGVNCFVESLHTAYRILGHPFKVAVGGGVFMHQPAYVDAIAQRAPRGCELIVLDTPVVYGTALELMWQQNEEICDDFKKNFLQTYAKFPTPKIV